MARKTKQPSTPALRWLREHDVEHVVHDYPYVERGGTSASAAALGVDEHHIVKTLVFEDNTKQPLIVLMHGDRSVSAKALARALNVRSCRPCEPAVARRHTGYQVGGTSPFGLRKPLPIHAERSILALDAIWINAGARGWLVELDPTVLHRLDAVLVDVAR